MSTSSPPPSTPILEVLTAGLQTTVQDGGRHGYRAVGVPRSGALDQFALAAANRLVGNSPNDTVLEVLLAGLSIRLLQPTLLAVTGAELRLLLDDQPVPMWTSFAAETGQILRFAQRERGARSYLAVAGGLAIEPVLGSCSTYLTGGWGGYQGRPLRLGDQLSSYHPSRTAAPCWLPADCRPPYGPLPLLRCTPGPDYAAFPATACAAFTTATYTLTPASNRIGYRLSGPPIAGSLTNRPSLGVLPGVVQIPPDQQPILLLADAQTTGGYPIIAVVLQADLPLAAQLLPGDHVVFCFVDHAVGRMALREQQRWLREIDAAPCYGLPI